MPISKNHAAVSAYQRLVRASAIGGADARLTLDAELARKLEGASEIRVRAHEDVEPPHSRRDHPLPSGHHHANKGLPRPADGWRSKQPADGQRSFPAVRSQVQASTRVGACQWAVEHLAGPNLCGSLHSV